MTETADLPDILCFGSADFQESNWVNAQHLMWRLSARHRVLYVNSLGLRPPRVDRRDLRKIARRLRAAGARLARPDAQRFLHVLSPLSLPPGMAPGPGSLLLAAQIRGAMKRLAFDRPLAWIFLPSAAPVLSRLPLGPTVYHCVDAYEANPGVDAARIRAWESDLLRRADLVLAASAPLAERLARVHPRVRLLANVADLDSYPPPGAAVPEPEEYASIPRPRFVYLGNLAAYKVDLPLLEQAAARRTDWSFVFVGGVGQGEKATETQRLIGRANVHLLGPRPRQGLASFLHHADAGLIPFTVNASTAHAFPMKFFEYLACGLPVVCAPLPGLAPFLDPPLAYRYEGLAEFLEAGERALAEGPAHAGTRRSFAQTHSWTRRMEEVEQIVRELRAAVPPRRGRRAP